MHCRYHDAELNLDFLESSMTYVKSSDDYLVTDLVDRLKDGHFKVACSGPLLLLFKDLPDLSCEDRLNLCRSTQ